MSPSQEVTTVNKYTEVYSKEKVMKITRERKFHFSLKMKAILIASPGENAETGPSCTQADSSNGRRLEGGLEISIKIENAPAVCFCHPFRNLIHTSSCALPGGLRCSLYVVWNHECQCPQGPSAGKWLNELS